MMHHLLLLIPGMALGGAERFNLLMLEHLAHRGFRIAICATDDADNPWLSKFQRHTDDISALPRALRYEDRPRFILDLIESRQIDTVLVTASMLGYSLLPYFRSHCPNVVFVDYVHMVDVRWRAGGYARASLNHHRRLDLSVVSSKQVKGWMVAQGAEADRVEECYINVDTALWCPARYERAAIRQSLNLPEDGVVILYAARLAPQKRPRLHMDVLSQLRRQGKPFVCLVAGDGPERQWMERYVARRGMGDCVRILGMVEPERMPEVMAASDIFFLPSQDEGIALTLYEAMAMELPVVAADVGGQRELVTPETGFLVPRGAEEAGEYARILSELIESLPLREQVGRAARARVAAHFDIQQMVERMIVLLERARELSQIRPRESVSAEEGYECAVRVVDAARREELSERLFGERHSEWAFGGAQTPESPARHLFRVLKKSVLRPAYLWGLEHGFEWLIPLKNNVYRAIGRMMR